MRLRTILLAMALSAQAANAQPIQPATAADPDATTIMARVAANQDATEAARTRYVVFAVM